MNVQNALVGKFLNDFLSESKFNNVDEHFDALGYEESNS